MAQFCPSQGACNQVGNPKSLSLPCALKLSKRQRVGYVFRLLLLLSRGRAYSSVGQERAPDKGEVSGSNPLRPTRGLKARSAEARGGEG